VSNASDPNDDKITYEFEVYATAASRHSLLPQAASFRDEYDRVPCPVRTDRESTYYWRSRAYDGKLYGDWMEPAASA